MSVAQAEVNQQLELVRSEQYSDLSNKKLNEMNSTIFKMETAGISVNAGVVLLELLWMSTVFGLGYLCGGKGPFYVGKIWREQCDLITAELIWRYRVTFNADYDQNFNHELEKFAVGLA